MKQALIIGGFWSGGDQISEFLLWENEYDLKIAGVVDLYSQTKSFISKYRRYETIKEALGQTCPDMVIVVVPNYAKNTISAVQFILNNNIDLFVQKLRLDSMDDVDSLQKAAQSSKARFFVGEGYRCTGKARTLKYLLEQGLIGRIEYVVWKFFYPNVNSAWMKSYRHMTFEDLAYHHLGTLHYLLGLHPVKITAQSFSPTWVTQTATNTIGAMLVDTIEGYRLNYIAAWAARGRKTGYFGDVLIEGEKGALNLEGDRLLHTDSHGYVNEIPLLPAVYKNEIDHGLKSLINKPHNDLPAVDLPAFTMEEFYAVLHTIYYAIAVSEQKNNHESAFSFCVP